MGEIFNNSNWPILIKFRTHVRFSGPLPNIEEFRPTPRPLLWYRLIGTKCCRIGTECGKIFKNCSNGQILMKFPTHVRFRGPFTNIKEFSSPTATPPWGWGVKFSKKNSNGPIMMKFRTHDKFSGPFTNQMIILILYCKMIML